MNTPKILVVDDNKDWLKKLFMPDFTKKDRAISLDKVKFQKANVGVVMPMSDRDYKVFPDGSWRRIGPKNLKRTI